MHVSGTRNEMGGHLSFHERKDTGGLGFISDRYLYACSGLRKNHDNGMKQNMIPFKGLYMLTMTTCVFLDVRVHTATMHVLTATEDTVQTVSRYN